MSKISILAGNPKVERASEEDIYIDPQIGAFEEAMKIVSEMCGQVAKISMLFDHPGIFKKQFVDPLLDFGSKKGKKKAFEHMKLSYLHPIIRNTYAEIAEDYGVSLSQISVASEDLCRTFVDNRDLSGKEYRMCHSPKKLCKCRSYCDKAQDEEDENDEIFRVNCAGITAATIYYLAKGLPADTRLITCWEYDPVRVKPHTLAGGTELAYRIFQLENPIEQRMLVPMKGGKYSMHVYRFTPDLHLFT